MRSMRVLNHTKFSFVLAALTILTLPANAGDVARVMPGDTALYIGWSQWFQKDAPEVRMQEQFIRGLLTFAAEESGAEAPPPWIPPLLEILSVLQTSSGGIGLIDVQWVNEQPDIQAALVVETPDAAALADAARKLIGGLAGDTPIEQRAVRGVSFESVPLPDTPTRVLWGVHGNYFLLTLSDAAADKVLDCIKNQAANLAAAPEFTFDRGKVQSQADKPHVCAYVDVQRVITRGKAIATQIMGELPPIVDQALTELGLTAIRSKYLHIEQQDGGQRMVAFAHVDGPRRGLLKFWDQKPLTEDDLKIVPKDAYWAEVGNLDLVGLWEEARRVFTALAPDQVAMLDGPLAMSTQMLGFSITDDLLPALGDTWAVFDAPAHGGIVLTGTVLVVDVKDAEALRGMLARIVQFTAPLARDGEATLKLCQTKHGEHDIQYLLFGGVPSPVAPAWGFADNRWVFGLFPQTVATALRQVDPKTRGESLLDNPDFKSARTKLPKDVQGVGYFDSKYFVRLFYPLLNLLRTTGVSMLAKHGVEIDLALMPPLPETAADVKNLVSTSGVDADGILCASSGSGAPLAFVAAGAALTTSVMLPSLARAREITKRTVSASNLRGIGLACHVHANDHVGKFPDEFGPLIDAGMVTPKMLHSPRDPDGDEEAVSYEYISGQSADSDPRNVLGYERPFGDEGTNALFVDGHVEWLKLEEFKRALRETYRRLEREDQLPSEFRE
jgi:prepilin-type processing-associated H-X9-DG protein